MEGLDYWRLCDELTIVQAALLIVGRDPGQQEDCIERESAHRQPPGYMAAKTAITQALQCGKIKGESRPFHDYDGFGNKAGPIDGTTDPEVSTVEVESLKQWLATRGINTGFFFPTATDAPDYLDRSNPRYAPKLAAAVLAWLSVTDGGGKTPKQALTKWLREHAGEFGLTDDEGKQNESGIEEIAKVANWQPGGGAPKTPGE